MRESLGLVETVGISTAIEVADVMVKAANVKILELENSRGGGYMTVKIVGDVGAVKAAVNAAKAAGIKYGNLVSASVIARPSDGMSTLFCNPKVPYQSVNKKPIPLAWEEDEPEKLNYTPKKDAQKKGTSKVTEAPKKDAPKAKATPKKEEPVVTETPETKEPKVVDKPKATEAKVNEVQKKEESKAKEEPKEVPEVVEEQEKEEPKAESKEEVKVEEATQKEEPKAKETPKETEGKSQAKPRRSSRRKK